MSQELVTVTIDGRTVQVPKGTLLVEAAKQVGIHIPVFCYHPKLDPAGLCRMCLVQVEKMPKPVTACTTPVTDGMVVHTQTQLVSDLRKGVLEFLLLNHPLDCPVCDKGGECDLQDLTFAYGAGTSRLVDPKEHKPKAVDLGPFIVLDEERCILCRRCVRYDHEVACETQLVVEERGHHNLIATAKGQPYEHHFTGNVIDLCPVGALTSELYRFKARPWDLVKVPAICTGCSVGCSVELHFRHGRLLRVIPRDNPATDGGWLCDRGRFQYQYVQSEERLTQPLVRRNGELVPVSWSEALDEVARRFRAIREQHGGEALGVIGGGRLTLEEAYLLQKLARAALGTGNVDHRVSGQVVAGLSQFPGRIADLSEADTYLLVDCLPLETAPVLDIRIRRGLERRRARLVAIGSVLPRYRVRHGRIGVRPGETAAVLRALAAALAGAKELPALPAGVDPETIRELVALLDKGQKIAVLWDGRDPATGRTLLEALRALQGRPGSRSIHLLIPGEQPMSRGAAYMGLLPGYLPGYKPVTLAQVQETLRRLWGLRQLPGKGLDTAGMLAAAAEGRLKGLYLVGANLALTWPDGDLVRKALAQAEFVVVQDLFLTETARMADVVLPAAPFTAKAGHYANLDGLVQAVAQPAQSPGGAQTDLAIFGALARTLGLEWKTGVGEIAREWQALGLKVAEGALLPGAPADLLGPAAEPAAAGTATVRAQDGELILVPVDRLYAGGGTLAFDPGMARVANRPEAYFHPEDLRRLGLAEGDPVTLSAGEAAVDLVARAAAEVIPGTVQVPRGLPQAPVNRFGGAAAVRVTRRVAEVKA
ncbi:MAG: NADH-quinone oxidoreductase subunit NuoG [Firmicutes bacterium]|nr:NADH-quinone oxidoreductase subunit NuoG [Bacillota bacterium]